jgi:hypothetical protein
MIALADVLRLARIRHGLAELLFLKHFDFPRPVIGRPDDPAARWRRADVIAWARSDEPVRYRRYRATCAA